MPYNARLTCLHSHQSWQENFFQRKFDITIMLPIQMCMRFLSSSCSKANKILNGVSKDDFQTIMEKLDIQNVV